MSWYKRKHDLGLCNPDECFYCKKDDTERKAGWDGLCHGCQKKIMQQYVAQIGPYWICDFCIREHFPNKQYSVNQAAEILEKVRGFR